MVANLRVDKTDCKGCKYHDEFSAACGNADSPYCADYWHSGCEFKKLEGNNGGSREKELSDE